MNLRARSFVFLGLALCASMVSAQITTGLLGGAVTDTSGAALPGVTIEATHQPTGTSYSTVTDTSGRFKLANVRVGGPYAVSVSLEGFHPQESTDTYVNLGEETRLSFKLDLETVTETVTVVGESNPLISPSRTGAASNIATETIEDMPNIDRGFTDFARLNPFFTVASENDDPDSISVAGRSTRYNNIQIDGAVNNDLFGLADQGTPGGQTDTTPISLDAIQEIQLILADYDVRNGGFSGGSINAITRSGANNFHGSVYYFFRDTDMVGDGPEVLGEPGALEQDQYGFRVGGPVTRDKIFFFVNAERDERTDGTGWSLDGSTGICWANCNPAVGPAAERFKGIMSRYGFDPGGVAEDILPTDSDKFFTRFDFNIGDQHQLIARYNYVEAEKIINRPRSSTYEWDSEGYLQQNETNSFVVQLNSSIGSDKFNEARIGYSTIKDKRDALLPAFPWVEIEDVDRAAGIFDEFEAGGEPFSTDQNGLDQEVLEITDDFTWIKGNHTMTFGTHNELFSFDNLFVQNSWGAYEFDTMDNFDAGIADDWSWTFVNPGQPRTQKFDVNQLGFYAGDQWTTKPNLTLTYGLRVDIPFFPDSPSFNPFTVETYGISTSNIPDGNALWSPRLGFNWDVGSDGRKQFRGGAGVFAGRTPYVWISNVYARTGIEQTFVEAEDIPFNPDPFNQIPPPDADLTFGEFNLIDENFEFPQVFRVNLAWDQQLPWWNLIATAELVWADSIKEIDYQNVNIFQDGVSAIDGRPVFDEVDSDVSGAYLIKNTSEGEATNFSVKLERPYRSGIWGFVSYTYGDSETINDGTSSRAVSNWQFNEQLQPNQSILSPSDFSVEHRFNASLSYRFNNESRWPTTLSGYYNLQSGRPYSYIYDFQPRGSVNNDGFFDNDLLFVPANEGDVEIGRGTWEDLDRYISSEPCLESRRGQIAKRNDCEAPWNHTLDIRIAQDIPIRQTRLQLTLDILNFVNLFDSDAGALRYAEFNSLDPITVDFTDDGRYEYDLDASITNPEDNPKYDTHPVRSRWRARVGIRWTF
jgi:hypothetical protein